MHPALVALGVQALSLLVSAPSPPAPRPSPTGEMLALLGVPADPREGRIDWELQAERGGRRGVPARPARSSPSGLAPGRVERGYLPPEGEVTAAPDTPGRLFLVLPDAGALVWVDDRLVPGEGRTREIELAVPARGRTVLVRAAWQTAGGLVMEERWVGLAHHKMTSIGLTGERARRMGR